MKMLNYLFLVGAFFFAVSAWAREGTGTSGGGNAVKNELFDFYENQGTVSVDIRSTEAFVQILAPILTRLDVKIPGLAKILQEGIVEKPWFFEPKPLSNQLCVDSSMIQAAMEIVACQNSIEVRLNQHWFSSTAVDLFNKAGLLMHELIRFQSQKNGNKLSDFEINSLTRILMLEHSYPAASIQAAIRPIISLASSDDKKFAKDQTMILYQKYCKTLDTAAVNPIVKEIYKNPDSKSGWSYRSQFGAITNGLALQYEAAITPELKAILLDYWKITAAIEQRAIDVEVANQITLRAYNTMGSRVAANVCKAIEQID